MAGGKQFQYPPEVRATVLRSFEAGDSAAQTAWALWNEHRLHMTRSAVCGMRYRMGLKSRDNAKQQQRLAKRTRVPSEKKERKKRKRTYVSITQVRAKKERQSFPGYEPSFQSGDPLPEFLAAHDAERKQDDTKSLVDLKDLECKWPIEIAGELRFCGNAVSAKTSYCPHHNHTSKSANAPMRPDDGRRHNGFHQKGLQRYAISRSVITE